MNTTPQASTRHFEDFHIGQRFVSPSRAVTREEIREFAGRYDPQPFHLDDAAALASLFGGLAASGWHTAAVTMALALQAGLRPAGGFIGLGVDKLRWLEPVRPGDRLHMVARVEALKVMRSRTDAGALQLGMSSYNQRGELVFDCIGNLLIPRRDTAAEPEGWRLAA